MFRLLVAGVIVWMLDSIVGFMWVSDTASFGRSSSLPVHAVESHVCGVHISCCLVTCVLLLHGWLKHFVSGIAQRFTCHGKQTTCFLFLCYGIVYTGTDGFDMRG